MSIHIKTDICNKGESCKFRMLGTCAFAHKEDPEYSHILVEKERNNISQQIAHENGIYVALNNHTISTDIPPHFCISEYKHQCYACSCKCEDCGKSTSGWSHYKCPKECTDKSLKNELCIRFWFTGCCDGSCHRMHVRPCIEFYLLGVCSCGSECKYFHYTKIELCTCFDD